MWGGMDPPPPGEWNRDLCVTRGLLTRMIWSPPPPVILVNAGSLLRVPAGLGPSVRRVVSSSVPWGAIPGENLGLSCKSRASLAEHPPGATTPLEPYLSGQLQPPRTARL